MPDTTAKTVGARIRLFRKTMAGCSTQQAFSAALGLDQQRLSGYENGTRIPHRVISGIVRMGANPYWLLFGEGQMRGGVGGDEAVRDMTIHAVDLTKGSVNEQTLAEFYILPLYSDEVAAASLEATTRTEIEGPAILHRAWCPHPRETEYVRVRTTGNSMSPTIPEGAIVTIDRHENSPDSLVGKVVAIALQDGRVMLRRLQRTAGGGFVGVPDSSGHDELAVHLGPDDKVIGLVQTVHARIG